MYIVFIVLAILLFILAASFYSYIQAFYVSNKQKRAGAHLDASKDAALKKHINNMLDKFDSVSCEWVSIKAKDGILLKARYHEINKGAPLHIQLKRFLRRRNACPKQRSQHPRCRATSPRQKRRSYRNIRYKRTV